MHKRRTIIRCALEMCVQGTTFAELRQYVTARGGSMATVMQVLRGRRYGGMTWILQEQKGRIKIVVTDGAEILEEQ